MYTRTRMDTYMPAFWKQTVCPPRTQSQTDLRRWGARRTVPLCQLPTSLQGIHYQDIQDLEGHYTHSPLPHLLIPREEIPKAHTLPKPRLPTHWRPFAPAPDLLTSLWQAKRWERFASFCVECSDILGAFPGANDQRNAPSSKKEAELKELGIYSRVLFLSSSSRDFRFLF